MSFKALRCVLEHLSFGTDGAGQRVVVAAGNDQLVLLRLADRAHDDGGGIIVGRRRLAKDAGLSDRTVKDALTRLIKAGVLERESGQGPKGVYRHRIPLCELCRADRSSGYSGNDQGDRSSGYSGPAADRSNSRMPTGAVATPKPYRTLPGPRDLARLQAEANHPQLDGSGELALPGSGGRPAPWNPPTARPQGGRVRVNPSGQAVAVVREDDPAEPEWRGQEAWNGAGTATLLPFPADCTSRPAAAGGTA
jgi:hypothetical protein